MISHWPHDDVVLRHFFPQDKVFILYAAAWPDVTLPDEVLYAPYFVHNASSGGFVCERANDDRSRCFGSWERDWQCGWQEGQRRDYSDFRQGGQDDEKGGSETSDRRG